MTEFGGPDALHELDLPERHAGSGEMRIRVHAATVNPTDTVLRNGDRAKALSSVPPPYVPGMDAAGVLEEIGEGVDTDLTVGEHVMAIVVPQGSHGAYAEQIVVPAGSVARIPSGADDVAAATLPMNGLTARLALDALKLRAGHTIAVTGAAGSFGGYVVQLAKAEGLRVVADASPADENLVRELGADIVVERGADVADRIRKEVPEGVDGLADGAVLDHRVIGAIRDGGGIATVRGFAGEPERGITYHPVLIADYAQEQAKLDRLRAQAESGQLTLRVARSLPAEQAAEAHRLLEAGGTRGRLVLTF
ncbi:NADPH:quinone reductase-like Zn-dependent oxidoreductase [Halopolyspora algeriensis]|uniref:NADPH:quinone reductase-like Zn-dependent oxidoreductase n=1 Tax=Halopolyspora algeriensis TaxID=1500506 RepID=A0A368VXS5_9ACTN|nr:NADPH:quinone reductase-like Zn-dependent oxidoreductase [Halopolyspora algeriensis]TQM48096.1 NADPH:quinone reductase-like Zn-dependent oxidoreductase [Halopolyspora algeriensis]